MDKKLSERVQENYFDIILNEEDSGFNCPASVESLVAEIAALEQKLSECERLRQAGWHEICADSELTATKEMIGLWESLSDMHELWLDAVDSAVTTVRNTFESDAIQAWKKENEQLRDQLAERDKEIERLRLELQDITARFESHCESPALYGLKLRDENVRLRSEVEKYKALFHEHYKGPL